SSKKARKFKKPASPSRKRTLVTVEKEEPVPAKKVVPSKKSSRIQSTGAQVKKVLKRRLTGNNYPSSKWLSGDEAKEQGDDEDFLESDDNRKKADDERNDYENQET
nr:hypothetical protein [Tanacetum cinerariifolium]